MNRNSTSGVNRILGGVLVVVLVAGLGALIVLDLVYWEEVRKFQDKIQKEYPVFYPLSVTLFCVAFAYWTISDIRHGRKAFEGIYAYRILLFGAGSLIFGIQAAYAIVNAF